MLTPFLFELRTVIDFMFTETSLTFAEWVRVEAIYAQVYQIKCFRVWMERDLLRGLKRPFYRKLIIGSFLTVLLMGALWIPLVFFAIIPALGQPNPPVEVNVSFEVGSFVPLYQVKVAESNIEKLQETEWNKIVSLYDKESEASVFLKEFSMSDVVVVSLMTTSASSWNISPPSLKIMVDDLKSGKVTRCRFKYGISRNISDNTGSKIMEASVDLKLSQDLRFNLTEMLANDTQNMIEIPNIFPKILAARNNGKLSHVRELLVTEGGMTIIKCFSIYSHLIFVRSN